ncbi:hypothetical protein C2845_PM04G13810 [Panicum miliaceum]|uniref:Uncharacterized protein n=1 Tax=Panicum miliaceum TaxID=4540 RepID=A0A3L6QUI1_PANMI|nr:hypothetical protein C2845_PM04G13810 [Panicum miliaceum]
MAGKKGSAKPKGKDSKAAATAGDGWRASKCAEADVKALVDENLLQPKEIIQWRAATGDKRLHPKRLRAATRKRKSSVVLGGNEDETPSSPNPKHTKLRVEEAVGDDTVKEQDAPSLTVEPSTGTAAMTLGQALPLVTVAIASPWQTPPAASKSAATCALDAAPTPKALK